MKAVPLMLFAALLCGCTETREYALQKSTAQPPDPLAVYAGEWAGTVRGYSPEVQVLLAHDRIVRVCRYAPDAENRHSAEGALLSGAAVCDGYAAAFSLLCGVIVNL